MSYFGFNSDRESTYWYEVYFLKHIFEPSGWPDLKFSGEPYSTNECINCLLKRISEYFIILIRYHVLASVFLIEAVISKNVFVICKVSNIWHLQVQYP